MDVLFSDVQRVLKALFVVTVFPEAHRRRVIQRFPASLGAVIGDDRITRSILKVYTPKREMIRYIVISPTQKHLPHGGKVQISTTTSKMIIEWHCFPSIRRDRRP